VRKNRKAHFTLFNIDGPPAAVAEVERLERFNEEVLQRCQVHLRELLSAEYPRLLQLEPHKAHEDTRGDSNQDAQAAKKERKR
jgi:small subunit ribosomal protein S6